MSDIFEEKIGVDPSCYERKDYEEEDAQKQIAPAKKVPLEKTGIDNVSERKAGDYGIDRNTERRKYPNLEPLQKFFDHISCMYGGLISEQGVL